MQVASCDADGVVKMWDARMVAEIGTMEAGQHPLNSVCLDRSATRLAAASNDGGIKVRALGTESRKVAQIISAADESFVKKSEGDHSFDNEPTSVSKSR